MPCFYFDIVPTVSDCRAYGRDFLVKKTVLAIPNWVRRPWLQTTGALHRSLWNMSANMQQKWRPVNRISAPPLRLSKIIVFIAVTPS